MTHQSTTLKPTPKLENAVDYLQRLLASKKRYPSLCKRLMLEMVSLIQSKNKSTIRKIFPDASFLKSQGVTSGEMEDMYMDFFYSQINDCWFKQETFIEDKAFLTSCKVLGFLRICDLKVIKNHEVLELHLKSSIDMIKELDFTFSLESKFSILHKVLENISYLIHYVNATKEMPGNEDILVVFIWCIVKARCETMKSNFAFLQLFVNETQKTGELGFAMTQLEASIVFIGEGSGVFRWVWHYDWVKDVGLKF